MTPRPRRTASSGVMAAVFAEVDSDDELTQMMISLVPKTIVFRAPVQFHPTKKKTLSVLLRQQTPHHPVLTHTLVNVYIIIMKNSF